MHRPMMILALGLAAAFWQAGTTDAAGDRVVMDAVIEVLPGDPAGHCLMLETGTLAVTLSLVERPIEQRVDRAVSFNFGTPSDRGLAVTHIPVASAATSYVVPLEGGLQCYTLHAEGTMDGNTAGVGPTIAGIRQRYGQLVALRLIWSPPTT